MILTTITFQNAFHNHALLFLAYCLRLCSCVSGNQPKFPNPRAHQYKPCLTAALLLSRNDPSGAVQGGEFFLHEVIENWSQNTARTAQKMFLIVKYICSEFLFTLHQGSIKSISNGFRIYQAKKLNFPNGGKKQNKQISKSKTNNNTSKKITNSQRSFSRHIRSEQTRLVKWAFFHVFLILMTQLLHLVFFSGPPV